MNTHDIELPPPVFAGYLSVETEVYTLAKVQQIMEADRKHHDRMLAHEWIRPALGLSEDAPYRLDFYAQEIEKLRADRKRRGEPTNEDAKFLDWLSTNLFERKWDGTIGNSCEWHLRGDWRHTLQRMKGPDIRAAITQAMQQDLFS